MPLRPLFAVIFTYYNILFPTFQCLVKRAGVDYNGPMKQLQRARWVTDKFILLMLGVFPLFVGFHGYNKVTASKFWFFAGTTGLWLAAVAALLLVGLARGERYRPKVRPAHLLVGAFLAAGGVSAMASDYGAVCLMGANRYDGYLTTVLYAACFFGVSALAAPRRRYVWAMGASSAVCCAIAVLQLFGYDPFRLYPAGTNYYDKYVAYNSAFLGTIGNTGLLSAYLCLAGPLLAVYAALSQRRADKVLFLPAALCFGVIAACDVDAGLVAAAGCALIAVPVCIQKDRAAKTAGCVSAGATALGLGALYFLPGKSGTIYEMSQVLHGHLADEFGSHRGQIWKQAWELFKEHPWLGGGPGTTGARFHIQWYSEVRNNTANVTNAHNVYLGYLVNMGIVGAGLYIAALVSSMITWIKRRKDGALYPALGAALLCYCIQDFFGLGLSLTAPMMWVIWGLLETASEQL